MLLAGPTGEVAKLGISPERPATQTTVTVNTQQDTKHTADRAADPSANKPPCAEGTQGRYATSTTRTVSQSVLTETHDTLDPCSQGGEGHATEDDKLPALGTPCAEKSLRKQPPPTAEPHTDPEQPHSAEVSTMYTTQSSEVSLQCGQQRYNADTQRTEPHSTAPHPHPATNDEHDSAALLQSLGVTTPADHITAETA